jgi:two-component system response regulator
MNEEIEILLIEDSENDAEMTMRGLKKHNIANKITHLSDGAEGLNFIFAEGEFAGRNLVKKPKLILLDLKMPKVDGIEVLRKLKSDKRTKTIPIVVLTSSKEDPDIKACYELGANSYIVKPVGFDNFSKAIEEIGMYWMVLNNALQ